MTPQTAVKQASKVIIVEPGTCVVSTLIDPVRNECKRDEFPTRNEALRFRRTVVVSKALSLLGVNQWQAQQLANKIDSGTAIDRVRASLRWITRNPDKYTTGDIAAANKALGNKPASYCQARQYSDQMQCACGLAWDINDPEPPTCPKELHQ